MSETVKRNSHRIWLGGVLILLGFLFLLDQTRVLDFGDFISTWWPLILIVVGLNRITGPKNLGLGLTLLFLGLFFQLAELKIIDGDLVWRYWPVLLILFGVWLVLKAGGTLKAGKAADDTERLKVFAILGGIKRQITSKQFRGGEATALLGGIDLDFRMAELSEGENELRVTTIMGGIDIRVPESWNVAVSGTPILGSIEDRTGKQAQTDVIKKGTLRINCFALLGGIEIKN